MQNNGLYGYSYGIYATNYWVSMAKKMYTIVLLIFWQDRKKHLLPRHQWCVCNLSPFNGFNNLYIKLWIFFWCIAPNPIYEKHWLEVLSRMDHFIQVGGHTDKIEIDKCVECQIGKSFNAVFFADIMKQCR